MDVVGVDLNQETILENREIYKGLQLRFEHVEAVDYVNEQLGDGTVFVSCITFMYFTQNELTELLTLIAEKGVRAAIALCEPTGLNLDQEKESRPCGGMAYSHDYSRLLKLCGYNEFRKRIEYPDFDNSPHKGVTVIVATTVQQL